MIEVEKNLRLDGKTLGLAIQVESQVTNDELFHQVKTSNKSAKTFKSMNVLKSKDLREIVEDDHEEWNALADKLFEMTKEPVFDPVKPLSERIAKFKVVANQIRIARALLQTPFPNRNHIRLSEKEEKMIFFAARLYWKYMFRPAFSECVKDGIGNESAGHLAGLIATQLNEVMLGLSKLRFVEYSAHDTTLLALASLLGIDIDAPDFMGHIVFELICQRSRDGLPRSFTVRKLNCFSI